VVVWGMKFKDRLVHKRILTSGAMESTAKTSYDSFFFYFWLILMGMVFILSGVLA
jgi:hypothetical protein